MTNRAFTLIEVLIVVAILAVLAAIVVPNFEEAQIRRNVSRVKSDLRTLAVGLDAYYNDFKHYPLMMVVPGTGGDVYQTAYVALNVMTTPVAYLPTVDLFDPFQPLVPTAGHPNPYHQYSRRYLYINYEPTPPDLLANKTACNWMDAIGARQYAATACILISWGPNRKPDNLEWLLYESKIRHPLPDDLNGLGMIYDPTNGTVSGGDIGRLVGKTGGLDMFMR